MGKEGSDLFLPSDNPFVEPALIYTNLEGGLGCFGAYNAGSLLLKQ